MILWRISRHRDLSGRGGTVFAGRWHHAGMPVVYLAESPASALIEICVHTSANDVPPSFVLLKILGPDLAFEEIDRAEPGHDRPASERITRDLGLGWLKRGSSALLRVPSALVPETSNYLLNPAHEDAALFHIEADFVYPFDVKLKG
jgi:RES domain-containing protein